MKNKKIIIAIVVVLILIIAGIFIYINYSKEKNKPEETLKQYLSYVETKEYEKMYELLDNESKEKITKEDFITRNQNIYEGIQGTNFEVTINNVEKENKATKIDYQVAMNTVAGEDAFNYQVNLEKENKEYHINWSSNLIFPDLEDTDKVRVTTLEAERGSIYDRNGVLMAGKGTASSVGLVPGKMSTDNQEDMQKIATLLGVSTDTIQNKLSASYVKEDTFVPIKTIASDQQELENELLQIPGVKISNVETRVYPFGEATSHLLGYVQNITAEELEENKEKGYHSTSVIGKSGIEKVYEDTLRGKDGSEIYIVNEDGEKKTTIAKQELENGKDIKLTIDTTIQSKVYEQFKEDKSCQVVMNYKTGELLALVSTQTFDSNDFVLGMSDNQWNELTNSEDNPLYNRYLATWTPGSSFKPVIAGIGLTTEKIDENENYGNVGLSWQKDSSWGDYKVTTMTDYGDTVNLRNALIYSDNIYFAKAALNIGRETLESELKRIGFGQELPLELGAKISQYTSGEEIESEIQLADTGYGQGEVLVNPIYMASIYSAFMNNGSMMKPSILYQDEPTGEIWIENAFTKDAVDTIREALIQAVEIGTAKGAKIQGITLAGKTGTAEIKQSKEDETGTEIGWFDAFVADEESTNNFLIISMVEDVKEQGGSHYLLSKVKNIIEAVE